MSNKDELVDMTIKMLTENMSSVKTFKLEAKRYGDIDPDKIVPDAFVNIEDTDDGIKVSSGIADHTDLGSGKYKQIPEGTVTSLYKQVKTLAKELGVKVSDKLKLDGAKRYDEIIKEYNALNAQDVEELRPFANRQDLTRKELDQILDITGRRDASGNSDRQLRYRGNGDFGKLEGVINSLKDNLKDLEDMKSNSELFGVDKIYITECKETEKVTEAKKLTVKEIIALDENDLKKLMTNDEFDKMQQLNINSITELLDMLKDSARLSGQDENEEHISITDYLNYLEDMELNIEDSKKITEDVSNEDNEIISSILDRLTKELGEDWTKKSLLDIEEITYDTVHDYSIEHNKEDINTEQYYDIILKMIEEKTGKPALEENLVKEDDNMEEFNDYEANLSTENRKVTEAEDTTGTISEDINTGVLPIVDVDMYSLNDLLNNYQDVTQADLDEFIQDNATMIIKETIQSQLPNAEIYVTGVYHPSQYNFSGDELEFTLTVPRGEYEELKGNTVDKEDFNSFLKANYSSYSGFISTMADNIDEFYNQSEWQQMVQVLMYNIDQSVIDNNNETFVNNLIEYLSQNFLSVDEEPLEESKQTCLNCGTEFEVSEKDISEDDKGRYTTCPECNATFDIKEENKKITETMEILLTQDVNSKEEAQEIANDTSYANIGEEVIVKDWNGRVYKVTKTKDIKYKNGKRIEEDTDKLTEAPTVEDEEYKQLCTEIKFNADENDIELSEEQVKKIADKMVSDKFFFNHDIFTTSEYHIQENNEIIMDYIIAYN